jgi:hypothetical protein
MKTDFYTYAYLREDGTPYYIGKGRGKRAYKKQGHKVGVPPKNRILILKQDLPEEDAVKHEIYMIAVFGRKDINTGCLRNRTNGGDGVSGRVWTEEQRRLQSETHKGKKMSASARRRMSESKKGRTLSLETRRKMSDSQRRRERSKTDPQLRAAREALVLINSNPPRFRCLVTGHESTAGPLSLYQRRRGIDTSLRERLPSG